MLIVSPMVFGRQLLLHRRALSWATATSVAATLLLLVVYASIVEMEAAVTAGQLAVAFLVVAVTFPWASARQLLAIGPSVVGFALFLVGRTAGGYEPVYVFTVLAGAAFASVLVARHLDLQRWAIFRETRARDEAMVVTRSLLNVARELSRAPDPHTVLDGIVQRTRSLLQADWCTILLRIRPDGPFQIAAGSARKTDLLQEGAGLEIDIYQYPTLCGLLEPGVVLEVSNRTRPDERWWALMAYFRTRSMLAAPMDVGGAVIRILAIGRGKTDEPFPSRTARILSGLGRQAAVAIRNARLFADLQQAKKLKSEFMTTMSDELPP